MGWGMKCPQPIFAREPAPLGAFIAISGAPDQQRRGQIPEGVFRVGLIPQDPQGAGQLALPESGQEWL